MTKQPLHLAAHDSRIARISDIADATFGLSEVMSATYVHELIGFILHDSYQTSVGAFEGFHNLKPTW